MNEHLQKKQRGRRSVAERRRRRRRKKILRMLLKVLLILAGVILAGNIFLFLRDRKAQQAGKSWSVLREIKSVEIVLDAGHGGKDQGTSYGDVLEKDITLEILKKTEKLLEKDYRVAVVREDDTFVELSKRAEFANDRNAKVFVSIHCNSSEDGSGEGIETFYAEEKGAESQKLAEFLQGAVLLETGARDRETKAADYAVIRQTQMPAALVEVGFLSNAAERELLQQEDYQEKLAQGIADGIKAYLEEQESGE